MATKTFTQAQLTANDVNTYAVKGDTFIASASLTAGPLVNCFSSAYDNYKIVVSNFYATADCYLWIQGGYFSGTTWIVSGYYSGGAYQEYSTGTVTGYNQNNVAHWQICAGCTTGTGYPNNAVVNLSRPTTNRVTYSTQATLNLSSGLYTWSHMGLNTSSQLMDSIRWGTTAGAVSSGTITVYGVVQA
jgi:hypothetical protein